MNAYTSLDQRLIADAMAAGYTLAEGETQGYTLSKPRREYTIRTVPSERNDGVRCFWGATRVLRTSRTARWADTLHLRHDMGLTGGCPCSGGQS